MQATAAILKRARRRRGRLIVIEGIDGAGTTTQTGLLARNLTERHIPVRTTCEPTGGPVGALVRQILTHRVVVPENSGGDLRRCRPVDPHTISLLFSADRMDHVRGVIEPALARGETVITDRYFHSTLAYQSLECDPGWLRELNRYATPPDMLFFIDLGPAQALERIAGMGRATDMYEKRDLLERVAANYRALMKEIREREPHRLVWLDGSLSIRNVAGEIFTRALSLYEET